MNKKPNYGLLVRIRRVTLLPFIVLLATVPALADYQLGRFSCANLAAPALRTTTPLSASLGSKPRLNFVRKVGGVGFDAVARPREGLTIDTLSLSYHPDREDGDRFVVVINGDELRTDIFDWELLPIARYANSDSTSCFTLFGELEDKERQESLQNEGARFLNYDAAFQDTLMGLRLFQLDILLIDNDFALDLPKDESDSYLLGDGESEPEIEVAAEAWDDYRTLRNALDVEARLEGNDTDSNSWVITDHGIDVTFGLDDDMLSISGEPFFYFWKDDEMSLMSKRRDVVLSSMRETGVLSEDEDLDDLATKRGEYERLREATRLRVAREKGLIGIEAEESDLDERIAAEEQSIHSTAFAVATERGLVTDEESWEDFAFKPILARLIGDKEGAEKQTEEQGQILAAARELLIEQGDPSFIDLEAKLERAIDEELAEAKMAHEEFEEKVNSASEKATASFESFLDSDEASGEYLKWLSERHVLLARLLADVNPAVWNAGRKTLRFSAFFRYCRDHHPDVWVPFLASLEEKLDLTTAQPDVTTPTVLKLPDEAQ